MEVWPTSGSYPKSFTSTSRAFRGNVNRNSATAGATRRIVSGSLWYWLNQYECFENRGRSYRHRESACRTVDQLPHARNTADARRKAEPDGPGSSDEWRSRSVGGLAGCRELTFPGER